MAARDEPIRELEHAPDSAEARQMRFDETETHAPPRIRHEGQGYRVGCATSEGTCVSRRNALRSGAAEARFDAAAQEAHLPPATRRDARWRSTSSSRTTPASAPSRAASSASTSSSCSRAISSHQLLLRDASQIAGRGSTSGVSTPGASGACCSAAFVAFAGPPRWSTPRSCRPPTCSTRWAASGPRSSTSANWHFIAQSNDYFAANVDTNPVVHFWSLAVEEQFYLCWPIVLTALFVAARRAGDRQWKVQCGPWSWSASSRR